ncbi:MAG: SDR family NAD(P)-dependent oxidoreductase [Burkholderiales bacterium]
MPDVTPRPTALITGASAGIGAALAECFARGGHDLVLVARSTDKLKELAARMVKSYGVRARVEPADLAVPGAASHLAARLKRARRNVDVLVNNAGVMEQGAFTAITPERHQKLIDLNISGLTAMLSTFVAPMVERGRGRVLNVASIAAFQPIPALAAYAATKAYVLSLSESLAEELRPSGVTVTALCPGITATDMFAKAAGANDKLKRMPAFVIGRVEDVAEEGFAACMKGTAICVPGLLNRAGTLASRATPKWLLRRVGGALARKAM